MEAQIAAYLTGEMENKTASSKAPDFQGEGVAYRGRLLVHQPTKLDDVDKDGVKISRDDAVQKYQRRVKFGCCGVFHSATMIEDIAGPIQFEVSMGNYGNKLDSTRKPLASTTQYSCPIYDGFYSSEGS
ncbi:myoferlin-like [Aquarana catesbeiana]|uniref:myoferlin-like n=1 Tax=Aquarana catesbeiana TaxID=8400 RepID=UPI003CCA4E90